MKPIVCVLFAGLALASFAAKAQAPEPRVEQLQSAADPVKDTVLIGTVTTGGMGIQFEIEGAVAMWMQMGSPPSWAAHPPGADERYHIEVKPTDPGSKTRIPYAEVSFAATNRDNGRTMTLALPPMWGSSGLHYAANSALLGDGAYAAVVTVAVPTFHRKLKDKALWDKPTAAAFHFRLRDGKIVEVTQPR